jgi:2-polyprenyl-6-methoxyphenol hydroxylase-like FAD-dependent oxidoreductase
MVKASSKITDVYETDTGAVLRFANGEVSEEFDLVVGCDGIKSVVSI